MPSFGDSDDDSGCTRGTYVNNCQCANCAYRRESDKRTKELIEKQKKENRKRGIGMGW